jgi:RNA polymerase sigma-70 factor (ECF subfamily)
MNALPSETRKRFDELVLPHVDRLVAFARRLSAADGEDYVQEAVIRAWRSFAQLEDEGAVRAWLFRIVHTVAIEVARKSSRRRELVEIIALENRHEALVAADEPDPLHVLVRSASDERVRQALDSIPEEMALAVELHDVHELKYREIAEVLGVPLGTVMSRISRGRRLLAAVLAPSHGAAETRAERMRP